MAHAMTRAAIVAPAVLALLSARSAWAQSTYYVAPDGDDTAAGTESAPFATWGHAQTAASPGDTVYFRGGTYRYTDATSTCTSPTATVNAVVLSKSGTSGNPIHYWAYPGEKPLFDFSGMSDTSKYSCRQTGVRVTASWLHLKGLELTGTLQLNNQNHESWCVYVYGGSNNVFEQLDAHHNMGPGFFIQRGGNNLFLNCDSHENEDTLTSNGDGQSADGFGCHPDQAGDTGNVFRGCRAWWNTDDGWDFINSQEACTVEYSWAWYSGYKPDAISGGQPVSLSSGNGNGFKGGGYGDPQTNVPSPTPQHVIRFDVAFYNKANGLYANHSNVNPIFYDNTSFNNGTDVDMLGLDGTTVTSVGMLRNNLAFSSNNHGLLADMSNGGPISDEYNSWDTNLNITVSAADFMSLDFAPPASCPAPYAAGGTVCVPPTDTTSFGGMASARQADGSLPVLPFLHLAANSQLIDRGTDVGLPYSGSAPDLGAFETGGTYDGSDGGSESSATSGGDSGTSSNGASSSGTSSSDMSGAAAGTGSSNGSTDASSASGSSSAGGSTRAESSAAAPSSAGPGAGASDTNSSPTHGGASAGGCGCQMPATRGGGEWSAALLVGAAAVLERRRRRRLERLATGELRRVNIFVSGPKRERQP